VTSTETPPEGRVRLDIDMFVATVTLDREAKLNALGPPMISDLERSLDQIDRDPEVRVVIVTAVGERAFCVGADVNAWSTLEPLDMWRQWIRAGHRVFQRMARLRQPTIAAINGYAFGGGLELALATDIRLAADSATFAMPETTLGTLPGWAGTSRLPALIGVARAKQLIYTGISIDAANAERWGLINEMIPSHGLLTRAAELAAEIAANAPLPVQMAKAAIDGDDTALEGFAGALAASSADGREGIAAFRERRTPQFTGR